MESKRARDGAGARKRKQRETASAESIAKEKESDRLKKKRRIQGESSGDRMELSARQNYSDECEAAVNKQVNGELCAMYTYMAMAAYFEQDGVALKGYASFFREMASEELEHAQDFMKIQNQRGGKVILKEIPPPKKQEWTSALEAMEEALAVEHKENHFLLELRKLAIEHGDAQLADFVDKHCLKGSVKCIKEIADQVKNLKRVGPGHGEWHMDQSEGQ